MRYIEEGTGTPVLLLHGWRCSTEIWGFLRKQLAQQFRVIAVDFPGVCPAAALDGEDWSMAEYADLIRAFVADRDIAQCHVLGHSFGARVILRMAEQPLPFGHVLLTGAAGIKPPSGKKTMRSRAYKALRGASQSALAGKILGEKAQENMREGLIQRFGSADYKALPPAMRGAFVRIINEDLAPYLPRVDRPTLLIWGENDAETPIWMGERMEKEIPDAALIRMENAGHYAFLDKPVDFARIAINFFGGKI